MKTMIQQNAIAVLFLIFAVAAVSGKAQAVVVPAASSFENQKQVLAESNTDTRLQQITDEITAEQHRHQERMENIKKELQQLKSHQP